MDNQQLLNVNIQNAYQALRHKQALGLNQQNDQEYASLLQFVQLHQTHHNTGSSSTDVPFNIPVSNNQQPTTTTSHDLVATTTHLPRENQQLISQIQTFRQVTRQAPIPIIESTNQDLCQESKPKLTADSKIMIVDPWRIISKIVPDHTNNKLVFPVMPSIVPIGIDPQLLDFEMDRRMTARMTNRLNELNRICNSSLPDDSSPNVENSHEFFNAKIKALIERNSIRMLKIQKSLRDELLSSGYTPSTLFNVPNRANFRKIKSYSLREPRLTEILEKQKLLERETLAKQKHSRFIYFVLNHGTALIQNHVRQNEWRAQLGKTVQGYHVRLEKEEKDRIQQLAVERLRALREGDEAAYLKLIDEAKDTRITHLLRQTDSFLEGLVTNVMMQQGTIRRTAVDVHRATASVPQLTKTVVEDRDEDMFVTAPNGEKLDYYSVAHRKTEPIERQASIMVGGTLKEYQIRGLEWMVSLYNNELNGILADEMGLGKTIQTISLITYLMETKQEAGPYLVIVPLSTITNWSSEFAKWAPTCRIIIYKGPPLVRKARGAQIKSGGFNVVLTTFEWVTKEKNVLGRVKWLYTIIDEGHRMKNAESKLSITLNQNYSSKYRLILTGTPLQNNLPELWALLNFILPRVFNSQASFDEWFSAPFADQAGGEERLALTEEEQLLVIKRLHKVLRPFLLRRLKKDVELELPDKIECIVRTKMSGLQRILYDQVRTHGAISCGFTEFGKKKSGVKSLNNTVMQLRKICNHPFTFDGVETALGEGEMVTRSIFRASGKFELLDRVLPKLLCTGHRVLMFFQMTEVMNIMADFLTYREWTFLRLDGSTKPEDRQDYLRLFNAPNSQYFIFLLSTRAGGLGLNLQTADTVIIFDSDWNPHQDLQAQDRAHRIGQTKEVRILRLITENSIEERILARAQQKLDMDGKVIQAGKFDNKTTAEEREQLLRSLLEQDSDEKTNEEDEALTDEDINEILARSAEELVIFKRMDQELMGLELQLSQEMGLDTIQPRLMQEMELPVVISRDVGTLLAQRHAINDLKEGERRARRSVTYAEFIDQDEFSYVSSDSEAVPGTESRQRLLQEKGGTGSPSKKSGVSKRARSDSQSGQDSSPSKRVKTEQQSTRQLIVIKEPPQATIQPADDDDALSSLDAQVRDCYTHLNDVLDRLNQLYDPENRARSCVALFQRLPDPNDYPTYYLQIKNPISLYEIRRKLKRVEYGDDQGARPVIVSKFVSDVQLMCTNARWFNQEGSLVYNDADRIEQAVLKWVQEVQYV